MIVNGFIVVTSLLEWKTKQSLKPTDTVLMCLGVTRILFNLVSTVSFIPHLLPREINIIYDIWAYLNWSGLWFVSLLSIIYCVKITNYNNCVFIYMKLNISKLLKWLILGNVLVSLVFILLLKLIKDVSPQYWINSTEISLKNSTETDINNYQFIYLFIYYLGSFLPFIMFCVAALLVIRSLLHHTQQIKSSGTGLENSHLKAHINVIRNMVFLFVLYIVYFVSNAFLLDKRPLTVTIFSYLVPPFYTLIHSGFLIYSNIRLRITFLGTWRNLLDCTNNQS
ncbi:hypothetical protein GDO86_010619 [Hymenochirus boettgeri]|uniref:Taste receptor type 2 n=1 Tax=Hymenochirus boettgeri TaxID=247094 RepID=A0A8T2JR16_9PIPI|nr:hypothetical protein GDO86_010619 [Hymenochirus boettgeri]